MDDRHGGYPSLSRGVDTFTVERLEAILETERFSYDYRTKPEARAYSSVSYDPPEFNSEIDLNFLDTEQEGDGIRFFYVEETKQRARKFCQELHGDGTPKSVSVHRLDAMFSKIFRFKFEPLKDSKAIIERVVNLLERMPARPLELHDVPSEVPPEYRTLSVASTATRDDTLWEQLHATTYVSSNVLRAALSAITSWGGGYDILDMTDIIATLLEIVSQLGSTAYDSGTSWTSFIIRAFLWTSWQRCQMIYFHLIATDFLRDGSFDKVGYRTMRGTFPAPGLTVHELSKQRASLQKSSYMCGWNFEALRTNPVCIGADFRRFPQRYNVALGEYLGRCLEGQPNSCKGNNPRSCWRFEGMPIENQSAHDQRCVGHCMRLAWEEMSYRSVMGARAVSFALTEGHHCATLQYCNASHLTLAISHVWSHGQGGRPETELNHCLHLRYSRIARSLGCDSYWIDTTCIPDDHQLRAESISKINEVFLNAKVMLVCDRDIMELDASNMSTEVCETLLITAIASDWNARAWTFFEAFRARRTLHLLCKNNVAVPLKQIVEVVHHEGATEIGNLILAMPHFLPPFDDRHLLRGTSQSREQFEEGHMPIELSGSLLSHRAASRPGDDFVIWSLLMSENSIFYNAEAFWKSMQGLAFESAAETGLIFSTAAFIRTGFLVSSAPRLKMKGLSWAPASPVMHTSTNLAENSFNGYDGGRSYHGSITPDGLIADWLLFKLDGSSFWSTLRLSKIWWQGSSSHCPRNLARIRDQYLKGYRWGAILCPFQEKGRGFGVWWEDGGRMRRTVVAVCATNETYGTVAEKYTFNTSVHTRVKWDYHSEVAGWEWRGCYVWDDVEPLPPLRRVKNFLIA